MASTPYEIVFGPMVVYYGNVGATNPTTFPSSIPTGTWSKMGEYAGEEGVTITMEQTIEEIFVDNDTAPQKAARTREGISVSVPVMDMSPDVLAKANNGVALNTQAGYHEVPLLRGLEVDEMAVLVYGKQSPEGNSKDAYWWMPRAYIRDHGPKNYVKGAPTMYTVEFRALRHSTGALGRYVVER